MDERTRPRDMTRARVVMGTAVTLAIFAMLMAALVPVFGISWVSGVVFGICGLAYATAAVALRVFGALRLATLLVASTLGGIMLLMAAQEDGAHFILSPWNVGIPLFVTYVAGPRLGIAVASVLGVLYLGVWGIHAQGLAMTLIEVPRLGLPTVFMHLVGLPLVSGFGWLYRSARDRAEAELEETVSALRAEENKLASVIESTDDAVASVDADRRLVYFNDTARSLLAGAGRRQPAPGDAFLGFVARADRPTWEAWFAAAARDGGTRVENTVELPGGTTHWELVITAIRGSDRAGFTLYARDITQKKAADEKLERLHQESVVLSRRAGMADVATNVLHNIGNALTSTSTSSTRLNDQVAQRERVDLGRLLELLPAEPHEMRRFMNEDKRAELVRPYLERVNNRLRTETTAMREELRVLGEGLNHIRHVIRAQQDLARAGKVIRTCTPRDLVETALRLTVSQHPTFDLVTEVAGDLPTFDSDQHKVVQILGNLLLNARDAVVADSRGSRQIQVAARSVDETILFEVTDDGIGIPRENLDAIFRHGFTTKPTGHGFGLHSAANDAGALGGRLSVRSEGLGRGATFSLELPLRPTQQLREAS